MNNIYKSFYSTEEYYENVIKRIEKVKINKKNDIKLNDNNDMKINDMKINDNENKKDDIKINENNDIKINDNENKKNVIEINNNENKINDNNENKKNDNENKKDDIEVNENNDIKINDNENEKYDIKINDNENKKDDIEVNKKNDIKINENIIGYHYDSNFKNTVLDTFIAQWAGIQQRDEEWYKRMGRTIGGSEIAAIIGKSKYKTREDVVNEKIAILFGEHIFTGGPACNWGILFEDVLCAYIEQLFDTKIKGDNICIQKYKGHRNSPDGYMIVYLYDEIIEEQNFDAKNKPNILKLFDYGIHTKDDNKTCIDEKTVLLEFKCPHSRRPSTIPAHYETQIQSGLAVSEIADAGLFVDACFRKHRYGDTYSYDKYYHNWDRQRLDNTNTITNGIIGVFEVGRTEKIEYIDFGRDCDFNDVLDKINTKKYYVDRCTIFGQETYNDVIEKWNEKIDFIGIIPWKLYEVIYTVVYRDMDFMKRIYPVICSVIEEVEYKYEEIKYARMQKIPVYKQNFTDDDILSLL